jgi:hypothetical protein
MPGQLPLKHTELPAGGPVAYPPQARRARVVVNALLSDVVELSQSHIEGMQAQATVTTQI